VQKREEAVGVVERRMKEGQKKRVEVGHGRSTRMKKKQGIWKRQRERQMQLEQQVRKLQEAERERRVLEDEAETVSASV